MQDRLNFFEPWERLPANHENQLTRALLVVLRYCPIAQQAWLSLVDRDEATAQRLTLHSLPPPTFDTQRAKILRSECQPTDYNESIRGISVLCAPDAAPDAMSETRNVVLESDRGMVLDGIIRYGDDVVVVLESKVVESADASQALNINLHGQPIKFDKQIRKLSWRDVLSTLADLSHERRGLTSGAERIILTDFLDFVDTNFAHLGPFNTLGRCEAEPSRVGRRLWMILCRVLGNDEETLPVTHTAVRTAYLDFDDESQQIRLRMYPADTLQQAKVFYSRPNVVEQIPMLETKEWSISPNFHFGFMRKGFCWTRSSIPLAQYMSYWQQQIRKTAQIGRPDWNGYWKKLEEMNIAQSADRLQFDRDFTNTGKQTATPRPGIQCTSVWSLDEAERLDAQGQLTEAVKQRINQLLHAVGEDKIDAVM